MLAAVAPACVDASNVPAACPTIASVTVGSAWIRKSTTTDITYPVTVVVDDPANIAVEVDTLMGRGLDRPVAPGTVWVGIGATMSPPSISGSRKTFTLTVDSPYKAYLPFTDKQTLPAYGAFQIMPVLWGVDPGTGDPTQALAGTYRSGTIKAQSAITNTPSAMSVHRAKWFTERGKLTRFDGTPQSAQKVNVYYVPAGSTRSSYAGTATTSSTGAFSLQVRSWLTGSWFVNYPGSTLSTGIYKSVWIRVS